MEEFGNRNNMDVTPGDGTATPVQQIPEGGAANYDSNGSQYGGNLNQGTYSSQMPPTPPVPPMGHPPVPPNNNNNQDNMGMTLGIIGIVLGGFALGLSLYITKECVPAETINDIEDRVAAVELLTDDVCDQEYIDEKFTAEEKNIKDIDDKVKDLEKKVEETANNLNGYISQSYGGMQNYDDNQQDIYSGSSYINDFMVLKNLGSFYMEEFDSNGFVLKYNNDTWTDPYYIDENTVFRIADVIPAEGGIESFNVTPVDKDHAFMHINEEYGMNTNDHMVMTFDQDSRVVTSITVYMYGYEQ